MPCASHIWRLELATSFNKRRYTSTIHVPQQKLIKQNCKRMFYEHLQTMNACHPAFKPCPNDWHAAFDGKLRSPWRSRQRTKSQNTSWLGWGFVESSSMPIPRSGKWAGLHLCANENKTKKNCKFYTVNKCDAMIWVLAWEYIPTVTTCVNDLHPTVPQTIYPTHISLINWWWVVKGVITCYHHLVSN